MAPPEAGLSEPIHNYITREHIDKRVKAGETLILYNNKIYNLTKFLKFHPGGELAVKHMAGCDATDEINALHPAWVIAEKMPHYYEGELAIDPVEASLARRKVVVVTVKPARPSVDDEKIKAAELVRIKSTNPTFVPVVEYKSKNQMRAAYQKLEAKVRDAGLFETNYWYYVAHVIEYLTFFTIAIVGATQGTEWWHFVVSAIFMGAFWHQIAFSAHDAGHNGITHIREVDSIIGAFLGDFMGGLSIGWWKKSHYVHHIVTNHPEHDPDIQQLPFFAISKKFLGNVFSSYYQCTLEFDAFAKIMIPFQHLYYYIFLLFGRFLLYFLSWSFLLTEPVVKGRYLELSGMAFYFTWLGMLVYQLPSWPIRVLWVLLSHNSTIFLHIQINLSHYAMSTEDLGPNEPFPAKMLRTTMDVDCSPWMDWFHGGLQFQAVHHLFPRMPRHNLRRCIPYVREFCDETGLEYQSFEFIKGNGLVLGSMKEVGMQVRLMAKIAEAEAMNGGHQH